MAKMLLGIPTLRLFLIITVILTLFCPTKAISRTSLQVHKVTLSAANIKLGDVFKKIYAQTGLIITNNVNETNLSEKKKVTVNFMQSDIYEVMIFLLNDKADLSFKLNDKRIFIFRTAPSIERNKINQKDTLNVSFQVSGKVLDPSGIPISGATVKIKNTTHGVVTDSDGNFNFVEVEKGTVLIISSIGFETKEFVINDKHILIKLNTYISLLDEKLVIAYGSTTKRLSTGNISSIKAKDIATQPVGSPLMALQGRVPGLDIQQTSGLPGSGVTVRVQGLNSLNKGNDPFYVIDGVPYISQLLPINNQITGNSGIPGVSGNPLNYMNPADIESIEILKDADATAIYGSRAANGAVLITTKKGRPGGTRVDATVQTGWSKVPHMMNLLNTKNYLAMRREGLKNDNASPSEFDYDLNGTWDTTRDINWQKDLIGRSANYSDAQLSVSGGSTQTQFLVAAGFHKETTVFPGSFSDTKGSVHFNITNNSFNQKFKIQLSGFYVFDNNKLPRADLTFSALTLAPVAPNPYKPDGTLNWMPDTSGASTYYYNPLAPLGQFSSNKTTNQSSNAIISYDLLPYLTLRSSFGYNNLLTNELTKNPISIYTPEDAKYARRSSVFLTNRISSWVIEPQLEFKYKISKGNINALVGANISQQNNDQQRVVGGGFNSDLVMEDLTSATRLSASTIKTIYKYNALYGRITYNWAEKYIINLSARRDGSSRFGPESQFHNFGAVGTAWVFSEEPFIQNTIPFLSFGKLRGSFGTTGNDQIGDYEFLDLYQSQLITGPPYQGALGYTPTRITNPYLQWEETKKLQMGIELGVLKNRVLLTVNYNRNRSSNQLISSPLPIITGFNSIVRNFPAVVQNTGWEFTLNSTNIKTKNFTWSSSFNLTIPKNQLLSYFGRDKNNLISIGKSITSILLFHFAGVNDTTGAYQFTDAKGNVTSNPSDPTDKTVIVNSDPKFYGGFQNTFTYKGFSVSVFLQFTKRKAMDYTFYAMNNNIYPGFYNNGIGNQSTAVLDRWQKPGDKATHAPFSAGLNGDLSKLVNSDAVWADASFIRLKNVSLSWQIPDRWKKTMHLTNMNLFMNMQNLLTITNYPGLDPETAGLGLPPLRTTAIGVQITL